MDEFQLIQHFFRQRALGPGVDLGPGDDAALLSPTTGCQLVMTLDTLVSGRHFPADLPAYDIGWRSLAVNLSDLAAMGASPRWCLLSLSMPEVNQPWLDQFCRGFFDLADQAGIALVGGDLVRGELQLSIQATGEVPQGKAILRSGARIGDRICVGGVPGEAAVGLQRWQQGHRDDAATNRFARPHPQLALGKKLRSTASACIDISDGLVADLQHLIRESGQPGAVLRLDQLPQSDALQLQADLSLRQQAQLSGGDDYLLLFTLPPMFNVPSGCHEIGRITADSGLRVLDHDGQPLTIMHAGWRHFE